MGSIFKSPPPTVVQAPSYMQSSSSGEVKPYAPVEPYLEQILPEIRNEFTQTPELYRGSLVPDFSAQTLAARDIYGQVGQTAGQLGNVYGNLFNNDYGRATANPLDDSIYQAQLGTISQQARQMTEGDRALAQKQAMEAGQFGLGSTALGELQAMQQQKREELAQRQMSVALQEAESRRIGAQERVPQMGQQMLSAMLTPASLQEAIGGQIEQRQAASQADAARLAQQDQEARRAQLITMANLFGGLSGLGSSTTNQGTSSGYTSQVIGGGPSPFSQIASAAGTAASIYKSDIRLKTDIKFVKKLQNGINVYRWRWNKLGAEITKRVFGFGVIAQEVQKIKPSSVIKGKDGYLMVNYAGIGN
jgi:hypothetical protein